MSFEANRSQRTVEKLMLQALLALNMVYLSVSFKTVCPQLTPNGKKR